MTNKRADFEQIFRELERSGLCPEIIVRSPNTARYSGVAADSRKLHAQDVFCAIKGARTDGHELLRNALNVATLAIVEEARDIQAQPGAGVIRVSSTRAAWSQLASFFAEHPTEKLKVIGVTGTNGKTSTTWLLKEILIATGVKCGSIGTLGFFAGEEHIESAHTTPDPDALYPTLASFVTKGITHVVMEVSSHSLAQGKVWPIQFDACAFTSFSQDHLDFHRSMEDYLAAKISLFLRHLKPEGFALVHMGVLDWTSAKISLQSLSQGIHTYGGPRSNAEFRLSSQSFFSLGFSRISLQLPDGQFIAAILPMVGDVFCENFSAALILASQICDFELSDLNKKISGAQIRPVPGRLELVRAPGKPWRPAVYVDYAHTPDALEKAILNLSGGLKAVSTVFGCGGDRDRMKRPLMGEIAARLSKRVFVTSDNPRSEDPLSIIQEILGGISDQSIVHCDPDRRVAIARAIGNSSAQEPVLIAGKGHESYQIIGRETLAFSDQREALACLAKKKSWLIVGAGITGLAAAKLLSDSGEDVAIFADNPFQLPDALSKAVRPIDAGRIDWNKVDLLVVSPGIPTDHPVVNAARFRRKEIITEIDLGLDRYHGSMIAVTGTNGKSTTVSMAEFLLRSIGLPADACGNIGIPPTSIPLWNKNDRHCAVIELSSYQLELALSWPAKAAAITSFSFDHLTRHKTMEAYFAAKWKVCQWLGGASIFIITEDVAAFALKCGVNWPSCRTIVVLKSNNQMALPENCEMAHILDGELTFDGWCVNFNHLEIVGEHNQCNAFIAAALASHTCGMSIKELLPYLRQYRGLPYRCERVFDNGERIIINDSKSTNLESTLAAMSLAQRPAVLLMGGQGKGESYHDLKIVQDKIALLITFGASGQDIAHQGPGGVPVERFEKMSSAVLRALKIASENKWDLIFSPGCASFDEFRSFEHRGAVFTKMVQDHVET